MTSAFASFVMVILFYLLITLSWSSEPQPTIWRSEHLQFLPNRLFVSFWVQYGHITTYTTQRTGHLLRPFRAQMILNDLFAPRTEILSSASNMEMLSRSCRARAVFLGPRTSKSPPVLRKPESVAPGFFGKTEWPEALKCRFSPHIRFELALICRDLKLIGNSAHCCGADHLQFRFSSGENPHRVRVPIWTQFIYLN